jgi:hypothetical protein
MRYRLLIGLLLMLPVLAFAGAGPTLADSDQYRYGGSNDSSYRYGDYDRDYGGNRYDNQGYGNQGYGRLPEGNWREACRNIVVRGDKLYADCRDSYGRWQHTGITYAECGAVIVGRSGELQCARRDVGYGGLPDGSYRDSCRNERIQNGYLLVARCADWNGQFRKTALDLRSCGRGDIQNRGGRLVCRGRGNGAWWSHNG